MVNSRSKGCRGERELAKVLQKTLGWEARRTQQFCGDAGDSDVTANVPVFIECKRVERLCVATAVQKAMEQAGDLPVMVCHRKDRGTWVVSIPMDHLIAVSQLVSTTQAGLSETQ